MDDYLIKYFNQNVPTYKLEWIDACLKAGKIVKNDEFCVPRTLNIVQSLDPNDFYQIDNEQY